MKFGYVMLFFQLTVMCWFSLHGRYQRHERNVRLMVKTMSFISWTSMAALFFMGLAITRLMGRHLSNPEFFLLLLNALCLWILSNMSEDLRVLYASREDGDEKERE